MAAHAFVIWRTGRSEGWDISIADIARVTGIDRGTVRKIVRARGWPVSDGHRSNRIAHGRHSGHIPVDTVMSRPDLAQAMVGVEG